MAVSACRAALALDRVTRKLAADPAVWALPDQPLRMDWALATGDVSIDSFGGDTPVGLSMVGEPVVLACRLEKFATDQSGPILACPRTRDMVLRATREPEPAAASGPALVFEDLGAMQAKGFDRPDHVFALRVPDD
jgi:class 3 adenylate cyclase